MKKENSNKLNKKGFTLIEMLVVVLIIGILAAIALPQYKNAVRKSRVAEAQIILRAIVDASDRYILVESDSTPSIEDIDIDVPIETKNWEFYIDECIDGATKLPGCIAVATPKWESGYEIEFASINYDGGNDERCGNFACWAGDDNGHKICKSLGGQRIDAFDSVYKI